MAEEQPVIVSYTWEGGKGHTMDLGTEGFPKIKFDFTNVPKEIRTGGAMRLLGVATAYCFCNTFANEVISRGGKIKTLTAKAKVDKAKDSYGRTRVSQITLDLKIDVDPADVAKVKETEEVMKQGSLMTYSLPEGVEVETNVEV